MRTSKLIWTTRILLLATLILCTISFIIGLNRDIAGETCSGIMGAQISCVQEQSFYPIIIGFPVALLLIIILTMDYISKTTGVAKSKKQKPKLKKY